MWLPSFRRVSCLSPTSWEGTMGLQMGSWNLNSGDRACMATTLSVDRSLQPSSLPFPLLKAGLLSHTEPRSSPERRGWLGNKSQESSCPYLLRVDIPSVHHYSQLFFLVCVCNLRMELRSSWWCGKHFINWIISPAPWCLAFVIG